MAGAYLKPLPPFSTIGVYERAYILRSLKRPLSGYLGGVPQGGYWIERLQSEWRETFGCQYAIACNSATSGLLAACMAIGIGPGDIVWTTAYTMSATAACAKVLGAHIAFIDIEPLRFSMNLNTSRPRTGLPKCIIVANLFGHPAYLANIRSWCDSNNVWMIEDNAQAPFAKEGKKYTGTIGHIGVFSLNVHKHLQSGEGGVIVTDDEHFSIRLAGSINHGELSHDYIGAGLNLRMTEPIAAIACAQLKKAKRIINSRRELALQLTDMVSDIPFIRPPVEDIDCFHVYYVWAALIENDNRTQFVHHLKRRGVPMNAGYATPLNLLFQSGTICPVAERLHTKCLITFEICAYDPKIQHLIRMHEIMHEAAEIAA